MRIAVLYGGLSNERDVSISSGAQIVRALRRAGHSVAPVDLFLGYEGALDGAFSSDGAQDAFAVSESAPDLAAVRALRPGQGPVGPNVVELCRRADIAFLALHGEEGENGKLQALLDLYGVRYTGSGYLGSALAMNKALTKALLRQAGLPVPEGITVERGRAPYADPGFPCVVKPRSGGSSVGTTIVRGPDEYAAALALAFQYEDAVIAERFIDGRELTVGVLDGKAMPVIEIIPRSGFYDYKNKYQPGLTQELCPAPLTGEETARVQALSERVYRVLGLEAYGRVDWRMDRAGELYCLEANTLPGMTPTSLVPQMARAMGMSYEQLCQALIDASLKKYSARREDKDSVL